MRLSLELVVIAIVILVVALVMLTIFGMGILQLDPLLNAKNNCNNAGKISCETAGTVPNTWVVGRVGPDGETCAVLIPNCVCLPDKVWSCSY